MELTQNRTIKTLAILLFLAALIQPLYTLLYTLEVPSEDRLILWRFEALIFVLMAAFAGAAMVQEDKRYALGFAAIAFSTVLNIPQVGIGLLQFGPFRVVAGADPTLKPIAGSVVALSFFLYNAAKVLLGLAAIIFGLEKLKNGGKILGGLALAAGTVALIGNTMVMMFGIQGFFPRPIAGGSGVVATLLLAICVFTLGPKDQTDA